MRKLAIQSILALALASCPLLAAHSSATIRDAQQALKDKGFDPGPVDGVNGPATRAALKKYQAQQNLNADGRFGPKTLDSLGVNKGKATTEMATSGQQVKNGYTRGGKQIGEGGKELGHDVKKGEVGSAAVDFGKGVGHGAASIGKSTGHAAVSVGKGIKNAVVPNKNRDTAKP